MYSLVICLLVGGLSSEILVQPALIITDLQECPAKSIVSEDIYTQGMVKLGFKISLKLIPFKVHGKFHCI
jgi:hypothetical protein